MNHPWSFFLSLYCSRKFHLLIRTKYAHVAITLCRRMRSNTIIVAWSFALSICWPHRPTQTVIWSDLGCFIPSQCFFLSCWILLSWSAREELVALEIFVHQVVLLDWFTSPVWLSLFTGIWKSSHHICSTKSRICIWTGQIRVAHHFCLGMPSPEDQPIYVCIITEFLLLIFAVIAAHSHGLGISFVRIGGVLHRFWVRFHQMKADFLIRQERQQHCR